MIPEVDTWSEWMRCPRSIGGKGEAFVWPLEFQPTTDLEVPGLGHKIVEGSSEKHRRGRLRVRFALPWTCRAIVTAWASEKEGDKWLRT